MKYLTILGLTIFACFSLGAQESKKANEIDRDKTIYEENIFNTEFGNEPTRADAKKKLYDRIPEELPDWVFEPLMVGGKSQLIGISDPDMDKQDAYRQALLRAKSLYALFNLSTISNITDDYTNILESGNYTSYETKFQDYSISKASFAYNNPDIVVVDTFFTKYNEAIVLVQIDHEKLSQTEDTLFVKGEHLQVFMEKGFGREKMEFFNLEVKDKTSSDSSDFLVRYTYKILNRKYEIISVFGEKSQPFLQRPYNYRSNIDFSAGPTDKERNFFRLNHGLWNAFITGVLSNISEISLELASHVKNSNDYYTLKSEGIIRTVARNRVSFYLPGVKLYKNQFYIELQGKTR